MVRRAADGPWAAVQDVCVDHGRADVVVAQPSCVAKEWRSEWELAGLASRAARTAVFTARWSTDSEVVPATLRRDAVDVDPGGREDPLPGPLPSGVRVLLGEGAYGSTTHPALNPEVVPVLLLDGDLVLLEVRRHGGG